MELDSAVALVLERFMPRVQVKAGNGLSRAMNQTLRSYNQIPLIIARTVGLLAGTEALFEFSGSVRLHTRDIYRTLMDIHDDWVQEVPRLGHRDHHEIVVERLMRAVGGENPSEREERGTIQFSRIPLLPLHQFSAAWTIGRRIGVIDGRGEIGLSRAVLAEIKRHMTTVDQTAS